MVDLASEILKPSTWHFCQSKASVYKPTLILWYTVFLKPVISLTVIFSMQSLASNPPMRGEASWQQNMSSMRITDNRWAMALLCESGRIDGSQNHLLSALSHSQIRSLWSPLFLSILMKTRVNGMLP